MLILYDESDYSIDKGHYINKDTVYTILDTETNKKHTIKGSSLMTRISKEDKSGNHTIKNVYYGYSPKCYKDIAFTVSTPNNITYNLEDGIINCNFKPPFKVNVSSVDANCFYIGLNDICLDFKTRVKQLYMDSVTEVSALNSGISLSYNSDCKLSGIALNNIVILENSTITFDLVFVIWNLVKNCSLDEEFKCYLTFDSHLCKINNKEVQLLNIDSFVKRLVLNTSSFNNECLY